MTEKLAQKFKEELGQADIYVVDDEVDLAQYDAILIGTPVYVGKINKQISDWIAKNETLILSKHVAVFLCGMNFENESIVIESNFSVQFRNRFPIKYVGGAYQFDKMNFFERFIVKKITGEKTSREEVLEEPFKLILNHIKSR